MAKDGAKMHQCRFALNYCASGLGATGESRSAATGRANFTPLIKPLRNCTGPAGIFLKKIRPAGCQGCFVRGF